MVRHLGQGSSSRVMEAAALGPGAAPRASTDLHFVPDPAAPPGAPRHFALKRALNRMRSARDREHLLREAKAFFRAGAHPHLVTVDVARRLLFT